MCVKGCLFLNQTFFVWGSVLEPGPARRVRDPINHAESPLPSMSTSDDHDNVRCPLSQAVTNKCLRIGNKAYYNYFYLFAVLCYGTAGWTISYIKWISATAHHPPKPHWQEDGRSSRTDATAKIVPERTGGQLPWQENFPSQTKNDVAELLCTAGLLHWWCLHNVLFSVLRMRLIFEIKSASS